MKETKNISPLAAAVLSLSCLLILVDVIELAIMLPEIFHACVWPHEEAYGGYEDVLFQAMIVAASLQFASLIVVCVWTYRTTLPPPSTNMLDESSWLVELSNAYDFDKTTKKEKPMFDPWSQCGFHHEKVPLFVDLLQLASIFTHLVLLAFHNIPTIITSVVSIALSILMLFPGLFIHKKAPPNRIISQANFHEHTRRLVLLVMLLTLALLIVYLLQFAGTFASQPKYYRSTQLRKMNDDRWAFNWPLIYHEWSDNLTMALAQNRLPYKRVVLIVLDGQRFDYLERNAAFNHLLTKSNRSQHFNVQPMEATLPTMSAPNWLVLLSGAKPEITGLMGNIMSAETEFDTIFSRQSRLDGKPREFMRGMSGCKWWSQLVETHFPRVKGDGSVSAYSMYDALRRHQPLPIELDISPSEQLVPLPYIRFVEHDSLDGHTDDVTDHYRTDITCEALNETTDPFRFFLVHFANIDTQAHYHGVTPAYNPTDSYNEAVTRTVKYIERILDTVDQHPLAAETHVIITADHGEVDPGGHGGTEPVLKRIPFIIYHPHFTWASLSSDSTSASQLPREVETDKEISTVEDVTPSVLALLGLPTTRQGSGFIPPHVFDRIDPALRRRHARDIYEAKRERLNVFLLESRYTSREWCQLAADYPTLLRRNDSLIQNATTDDFLRLAKQIEKLQKTIEGELESRILARNICLTLILVFSLVYCVIDHYRKHSLVFLAVPWPTKPSGGGAAANLKTPECAALGKLNRWAILASIALTAGYVIVVLSITLITYAVWGYPVWDSTMAHSPSACIRFALIALLPGIIIEFLIVRVYHVPSLRYEQAQLSAEQAKQSGYEFFKDLVMCLNHGWRVVFVEVAFYYGHVNDMTFVYFVRLYMYLVSLLLWCALLIAQSVYTFVIPFMFGNWIVSDFSWGLRFRVLTVQLMCLPLLIGNAVVFLSFSALNARQLQWRTIEKASAACGAHQWDPFPNAFELHPLLPRVPVTKSPPPRSINNNHQPNQPTNFAAAGTASRRIRMMDLLS